MSLRILRPATIVLAALAFFAAPVAFVRLGAVCAQDEPEEDEGGPEQELAQQVQEQLSKAYDEMMAGGQLLEQAKASGDEAKRGEAMARYDAACKTYAEALKGLDGLAAAGFPAEALEQPRQIAHYNVACARSLQGRTDEAIEAFKRSLEAGYDDFKHMEEDTDLDPIRKEPRFVQLLERAKSAMTEKAAQAAKSALSAGAMFPYDFKVTTLDGKPLALSDLAGKVVIVDYWGTWCPPCREEIPHFVALQQELGDKLAIVGMTWEGGKGDDQTKAKVLAFAKEVGIRYPLTLLDDRKQLEAVPGLDAFPTTLFLDKTGRVRAKEVGYRDLSYLRALVGALVAEEAAPAKKPSSGELGPF